MQKVPTPFFVFLHARQSGTTVLVAWFSWFFTVRRRRYRLLLNINQEANRPGWDGTGALMYWPRSIYLAGYFLPVIYTFSVAP